MRRMFGLLMLVCLCGASPRAWAQTRPAVTAFVHPGMYHSKAELDFVRQEVLAGVQPRKSWYDKMVADSRSSLAWTPKPIAHVARGAFNSPNIGADDMGHDANAAYSQALQWYVTRDSVHARKAIAILNAWSGTLQSITNHDALLLTGMRGHKFCNAAEIIRFSYPGWPQAEQDRFKKMMIGIFYPVIQDFFPGANGNWDESMVLTMLCIGIFAEDTAIFNRAVNYAMSGPGNGAIGHYINDFGECQESGRDQGHTQLGLGFLASACEVAWKQGVDLYGALGNRLALGFEYTAQYNLGQTVRFQPYRSIDGAYNYPSISAIGRGNFQPVYEKVYHHYHDLKGMPMPFTLQVVNKMRPEGYNIDHIPWGSLMFANLPPSTGVGLFHPGAQRQDRYATASTAPQAPERAFDLLGRSPAYPGGRSQGLGVLIAGPSGLIWKPNLSIRRANADK